MRRVKMKELDEKEIQEMIDKSLADLGKVLPRDYVQRGLLVAYCSSAADAVLSNNLSSDYARTASAIVRDYKFLFNYSLPILTKEEEELHRGQIEDLEKMLGNTFS